MLLESMNDRLLKLEDRLVNIERRLGRVEAYLKVLGGGLAIVVPLVIAILVG